MTCNVNGHNMATSTSFCCTPPLRSDDLLFVFVLFFVCTGPLLLCVDFFFFFFIYFYQLVANCSEWWLLFIVVLGLLIVVASQAMGSSLTGFSIMANGGLIAWPHVGSTQTQYRIHVPCTDRQILNYWTTRGVLNNLFLQI